MSDIVKQLRDEPSWYHIRRHGLPLADAEVWHKTCCIAADEIERLQAKIDEYEQIESGVVAELIAENSALKNELKAWKPDFAYEGKACPGCGRKYKAADQ